MTVVSQVREVRDMSLARDALLVIGGGILISLFARIAIPLPFTPVPIAMQMNVCIFLGMLLGARRGAAAVLVFLAQGAFGLPVFANGKAGLAVLLGPTGGYLIGYVVAAFLAGYIWERCKAKSERQAFLAMAIGNLAVYVLGVAHLSQITGFSKALLLGVAPFVIGDLFKLFLGVRLLKTAPKPAY